jgi:RNA polymerase sigma-70 factor (ECF subfamily)
MSEETLQELDDSELVARAKEGETQAYGILYERHVVLIYRYIRSKVNDNQTAEDLCEKTFLRAFERIAQYRERGKPYSAYLYRIARNIVVDHYRKVKPEVQLHEDAILDQGGAGLEDQIVALEEAKTLLQCLELLSDKYQEVIRLRIIMEMPTESAAKWMGKSEGATRVLLHRALKALRRELGNRNA